MEATATDYRHMSRALQLARLGCNSTQPNPRVGCVLVSPAGAVVGEGWHRVAGEGHAEVLALAVAGAAARGATAYVSLEPCCHSGRTPPCTEQLIAAGVARVVYALRDPNPLVAGQGVARLQSAGIEVCAGILEAEALELNRGFVSRMQRGRPWLRSKIAVSLDGRTALASGASKWITGEAARNDVQVWRAQSAAILTGAGTVLQDDPQLNARGAGAGGALPARQPLRVVVDGALRVPSTARVFSDSSPVLVACTDASSHSAHALRGQGVEVVAFPAVAGHVSLPALLKYLAAQGINEVLVEAGPGLNGALLDAGLIDEFIVYQAATIMGADARGMFNIAALPTMGSRFHFKLLDVRRVGDDLRLIYRPLERDPDTHNGRQV